MQPRSALQSSAARSYGDIVRTNLFGFFHLILFAVGCALIALLTEWRGVSPDRRPAFMAAGLAAVLVTAFSVPAVADYLGFIPPGLRLWGIMGGGLVLWAAGLALFWRKRWMNQLLSEKR